MISLDATFEGSIWAVSPVIHGVARTQAYIPVRRELFQPPSLLSVWHSACHTALRAPTVRRPAQARADQGMKMVSSYPLSRAIDRR